MTLFRRSEIVPIAFLLYAAALAALRPVSLAARPWIVGFNLWIIACWTLLAWADSLRRRLPLGVLRDWFPFVVVLLAYRQMGWFALPHATHPLEDVWVVWDRAILRGGLRAAIESLGPVLPSLLEISYSLVYAVGPSALALLYLYRRRTRVDILLTPLVLAVLLCYAQFPMWPSDPPRALFPGQDLPAYDTIFRRFNLWLLGNYGMHTSVFPSAHVAGAFAAALGLRRALPEHPWAWRFLFCLATAIALATVYGRYHYLADAAAGVAMALVAYGVAERWTTSRQSMK